MRSFTDKPYRFFPPKYKPAVAWFLRRLNRHRELSSKCLITGVDTSGGDALAELRKQGTRLLFLPNHGTHADGAIATEALRQVGVGSAMMAAYDVFLRSRWRAWAMQSLGSFSVDRECCDRRALKHAEETLARGRLALTIFPEGHVYLQNDRVTPFSEGALFIGLTAARRLAREGGRVLAVPVSMKATYVVDVRAQVAERMRGLAESVDVQLDGDMTARDALRAIGLRALARNLQHRGVSVPAEGALPERLRAAAAAILDGLAEKVGAPPGSGVGPMEHIRHARRVAHEVLLDPEREVDHAAARLWSDEAMLAWRIASYSGDYVASRPSQDRVAETLEKLEEDAFARFVQPFAPRRAIVRFGEPLDLSEAVADRASLRPTVRLFTSRVEEAVQQGLDAINNHNEHVGGRLWSEPLGDALAGG